MSCASRPIKETAYLMMIRPLPCNALTIRYLLALLPDFTRDTQARADATTASPPPFRAADASYAIKTTSLNARLSARTGYPRISARLHGRQLYARSEDKKVFIAAEQDSQLSLTDPVTQQPAGTADSAAFDKIGTNNSLRKALRGAIAQFDLASDDAAIRLAAVKEMQRSPDDTSVEILRQHLGNEKNSDVRQAVEEGLALADLSSESAETRLAALDVLSGSLNSDGLHRLQRCWKIRRGICRTHERVGQGGMELL